MDRSTRQLEPVIGERAALLLPWASLWIMAALVLGLLVFLPAYVFAGLGRSPAIIVVAAVSGSLVVLALGAAFVLLVKVNRSAGRYISDRSGTRMRFWGAYATAEAWRRAIRKKARKPAV
jgi:hypothetical protein